ncbi:MAG: F0F1 ATP synthase subunit A [bacterium]
MKEHEHSPLMWFIHNVSENPIAMTGVVSFIIIVLALLATRNLKEKPGRLQNFFELFIEAVLSFITAIMGEHGKPFLPLFGTLAIFILLSNLVGLIPGCGSPTGNWNTTIGLALAVFLTTHYIGIRKKGLNYLSHFLFPIRFWKNNLWLLPLNILADILFIIIHLMGELAKPFSLSLRLFVNMFSKHTTLLCLSFVVVLFAKKPILYVLTMFIPVLLPPAIMALGIITCCVQTLVFFLLSIIYVDLAMEETEH